MRERETERNRKRRNFNGCALFGRRVMSVGAPTPRDPFDVAPQSPSLYGRMMRAIKAGHSLGNAVRMLKAM